jgi:excisionase family DNA binding protein
LLTVEAAAGLLSVSRSFVYQLITKGELPSVRIGGCRRVDAAALRQWLDEQGQ